MARLMPDDIDEDLIESLNHRSEFNTLRRLRDGLSSEYTIYHAIHWASVTPRGTVYGEIDFIVANRYGRLLAIEQKDGTLYTKDGDLKVDYRSQRGKSVTTQINRNLNALRNGFSQRYPNRTLLVDHLLYVPNGIIDGQVPISIDPTRIVDASRSEQLCEIIDTLFNQVVTHATDQVADPLDVAEFLSDTVQAAPHVGLIGQSASAFTSRMSGGLATWVQRLTFSPFRLRVRGTAGSGKTQLALQELRQANHEGKTALYLCYNRPLADAIKALAPNTSLVMTIHELGKELGLKSGWVFDFNDNHVYDLMITALYELASSYEAMIDVLIVDEAQDMQHDWIESVFLLAKPQARVLVLDDPSQMLYERQAFQPDDWPMLESPVNYRSPRNLVVFMNELGLTDTPIEVGSGILGFAPSWRTYNDQHSLLDATESALKELLSGGYDRHNIAILSFQGHKNSLLLSDEAPRGLAGIALKRSAGYTDNGELIYTHGDLLVESIKRFKGQSADAVIITEIDFDKLDDDNRRLLFVALTRARVHAVLVASERASDALMARLEQKQPSST